MHQKYHSYQLIQKTVVSHLPNNSNVLEFTSVGETDEFVESRASHPSLFRPQLPAICCFVFANDVGIFAVLFCIKNYSKSLLKNLGGFCMMCTLLCS